MSTSCQAIIMTSLSSLPSNRGSLLPAVPQNNMTRTSQYCFWETTWKVWTASRPWSTSMANSLEAILSTFYFFFNFFSSWPEQLSRAVKKFYDKLIMILWRNNNRQLAGCTRSHISSGSLPWQHDRSLRVFIISVVGPHCLNNWPFEVQTNLHQFETF